MHLTFVDVWRFFGIDKASIDFKRIQASEETKAPVLIIGANGQGKTAILRSIQFFVEQYPFLGSEDNPYLSWKDFECWQAAADRPSLIHLRFELEEKEQRMFLQWRRLGLAMHLRSALQDVRQKISDEDDIAHIQRLLHATFRKLPSAMEHMDGNESTVDKEPDSSDSDASNDYGEDYSGDDQDHDDFLSRQATPRPTGSFVDKSRAKFEWEDLLRRLEELHKKFEPGGERQEESPFAAVVFQLHTLEQNPAVARYTEPVLRSRIGLRTVTSYKGDYRDPEEFKHLAGAEKAEILKFLREKVGLGLTTLEKIETALPTVYIANKILHDHLTRFYHKLPVLPPSGVDVRKHASTGRTFILEDDYIFRSRIKKTWAVDQQKRSIYKTEEKKTSERQQKHASESQYVNNYHREAKTHYDGSAAAESRQCCHYVPCQVLEDPKNWRTRHLRDPLLVRLHGFTPFPHIKDKISQTIGELSAAAFPQVPEKHQDPPLHRKGMNFVIGALLRVSVAWLQQDRTRFAASIRRPDFPAAGLLDFNLAEQLLLDRHHDGEDAVKRVSAALMRVTGIGLITKFAQRRHGKQATTSLLFCRSEDGADAVPIQAGSGGQREAFLVLVLAEVSSFSTIFIDEPGHNLHPSAQATLLHELERVCAGKLKSIVLVTHSQQFVNKLTIKHSLMASRGQNGCTVTCLREALDLDGNSEHESKSEQLSLPPLSQLFFSTRVLLVEGTSDMMAAQLMQHEILDTEQHAAVINLGGSQSAPLALRAAVVLRLNVTLILDIDWLFASSTFSNCIQQPSCQLVQPSESKIKRILQACDPNYEFSSELSDLMQSIKLKAVFERCSSREEQENSAAQLLKLRHRVWEESSRRVIVLARDLEEEFVASPAARDVLLEISDSNYVPFDEQHTMLVQIFMYLLHYESLVEHHLAGKKNGADNKKKKNKNKSARSSEQMSPMHATSVPLPVVTDGASAATITSSIPTEPLSATSESTPMTIDSGTVLQQLKKLLSPDEHSCTQCRRATSAVQRIDGDRLIGTDVLETAKKYLEKLGDKVHSAAFTIVNSLRLPASCCSWVTAENLVVLQQHACSVLGINLEQLLQTATSQGQMRAAIERQISRWKELLKHEPDKPVEEARYKDLLKRASRLDTAFIGSDMDEFELVPLYPLKCRSPLCSMLHESGWKELTFAQIKKLCEVLSAKKDGHLPGNFPQTLRSVIFSLGESQTN
eukprot:m.24849 g.24849  ORF g.24849 m.24849 type:complete len:1221 (+) comp9646_c1_seq1:141-3803(+)